jgi:hypothetical protein
LLLEVTGAAFLSIFLIAGLGADVVLGLQGGKKLKAEQNID